MDIADLKTFISIVDSGGITAAAKRLHRVPSSITARIQQLECSLGVQLFLREKKRLLLTREGQSLYNYAQRIVMLVQEAENKIKQDQPGGKFRLGAMDSMAATRLPEPLAALYSQYPDIALDLTTGISRTLYELLLDNQLDAAFIADAPKDDRLERIAVYEEALVLISPANHKPIKKPGDIKDSTVLAFKDGCSYRDRLVSWFHAADIQPMRIAEMSSYHAILGGVSAGMGVATVPTPILSLFPQKNLLRVHRISGAIGKPVTELIWRKGMLSSNITALRKCIGH